jgi:hypothetical protein
MLVGAGLLVLTFLVMVQRVCPSQREIRHFRHVPELTARGRVDDDATQAPTALARGCCAAPPVSTRLSTAGVNAVRRGEPV